jgi:rhodanese-related sulfurtransferase
MIRTAALLVPLLLLLSCRSATDKNHGSQSGNHPSTPEVNSLSSFEGPAQLLLEQLRDQGDYVNSRQYPSMIKAETIHAELEGNVHIIDIRNPEQFARGHIKGAFNLDPGRLLSHFENDILPFQYDKIILVDEGGQKSAFATHLLRLMGYGNVYSMRWGMSAWHRDFSGFLREGIISGRYEDRLETQTHEKPAEANQPGFQASGKTGEEILRERVETLLQLSGNEIFISAEEVFADPGKYFIINWERRDKYEAGHIPGAIRYKPQGTLGIPSEMGTLPPGRTIVLYCGTGMSSAFAAAYLRLFGYDARSLIYGNNSFMHGKMLEEQAELSWQPFTEATPGDFPYVN